MLSPTGASALSLEQVGNFATPTYVTSDPGDPDRLFVVERSGRIKLVENGETGVFLDIEPIVLSPRDDRAFRGLGLYSMAFSPEFATDSLFYVAYSSADDPNTENEDESGEWHIAEFTANGDSADPASRREVLTIKYPEARLHYAGQLHFGPDGYLFASTGDGGPQGDPDGNAQNLNNLYGNILRIDPHSTLGSAYTVPADNPFAGEIPGKDEIWSYGLRNPWRFSFDRLTGDLVIGDVGHGAREEVDFATGPDPGKGANFGWNCWQGTIQFSTAPPCDAEQAVIEPVFEYEHLDGNCSITGGYVVRDPALGDLDGRYLYADFCVGELRSLALEPPVLDRSEGLCVQFPTSFGEDSSGRIYVTSFDGPVYRLAAGGSSGACAPDTVIDTGPTGTTSSASPSFGFSSSESGSSFECRLDAGTWSACSSPKSYASLSDGSHTFEVRATDASGNTDPTPATRTFTVDTTPPDTTIDSGPTGTIATNQATFTFSGTPAGDTAKVQCKIDSEPFADCTSPKTFTGLTDGP
ncbi:MAG: PQQ-dependent sugar dehydrogenase, partial [Thermoleophilia bacterium]|nr:PQQ-dependent sugar dehydrogenase [Thermoleophilia bacterium]